MEETTDDQNSHQNLETYEESYNSLNAELETVPHDTLTIAVASITDTELQQEQQDCQTMNVTIQEQYNSTTQTTNHEETKDDTTKPDVSLKQILDHMKILTEKIVNIENQNLNQQNNNGNPMNTPPLPSTSKQLPIKTIETITIKEETISDNETDLPSQTCDGNDKKRKGVQCPLCNKALQNEIMLKAHLKAEHKMPTNLTKPQTNPPTDQHSPKIKCQICHIIIKSQHMLEEHISIEHGCKILSKRTSYTNLPTNDYNPPIPSPNMNPDHSEFYRNHPWESRVTAANRRIYKTSENEFYKEVIGWILEEVEHDLKQNPRWKIRVCTRNKNTNNTIFIITADHTSPKSANKLYKNRIGRYSIPMLFFTPNGDLRGVNSTITQHIDIMPSVLDYIGYSKPYFAFGESVFQKEGWAINFNKNKYCFITKNSFLNNIDENYTNFSNWRLTSEISSDSLDINKLKALKQVYSESMRKNRLNVE